MYAGIAIVMVLVLFFTLVVLWQRKTGQVEPVYVRERRARNSGGNYPIAAKHYIDPQEYEDIYAR